jgi:penicillin-binding protein 1A
MAKAKKQITRKNKSLFLKFFWGTFITLLVGFSLLIFLISMDLFGKLPTTRELENPETPLATEVYSADSVLLGKYYNENRSTVSFDEISPNIINALICTEDIRFYKHAGIDWRGLVSVPYYLLRGQKRGASTISQQLAKNLFPRKSFDNIITIIIRKIKEWIMSIRLEKYYTKEEIVTMYLNTVDFGSNSYGIKAACKTFFDKNPDSINVQEAATLIGLLKATYHFSPRFNPEKSIQRRNIVLSQMAKYDYLSQEAFDSIAALPISLKYKVESHNIGMAPYFREFLRMELRQWCKNNNYDLYSSGLKIYTTIDSRMQKYAEKAARKHLVSLQKTFYEHWKGRKNAPFYYAFNEKKIQELMHISIKRTERYRLLKNEGWSWEKILANFKKASPMKLFSYTGEIDTIMSPYDSIHYYKYFLHTGFMAMEPASGQIKAWVGGIDYRYFKYDHVNINTKRQVGSTFKPFVYTTAILNGYSPCMKLPNTRVVFPEFDNYSPQNSDGKYGGMMTMQKGLALSVNTITAGVLKKTGCEAVVKMARAMGIQSPLEPYPSIALGPFEISVFEMTGAFNTYANGGVWIEPNFIVRIEDKNGNVLDIEDFTPKDHEVLDEGYNYVMLTMLQAVVNHGTAMRLRYRYNILHPTAGKTGTTQNNSDGWFIGITPGLAAGCWVGANDRYVNFRSTALGQGANTALPIYAYFMQQVYADSTLKISTDEFPKPEDKLPVEIDCSKYKDAGSMDAFESSEW